MLSAQELNANGEVNFSVETNALEVTKIVLVVVLLVIKMRIIITVARNPTHPVNKPGMETFNVKDKNCPGIRHVMDLVHTMQSMD